MTYEKVSFYHLSGTGNSMRAASWMAREASRSGAGIEVSPMAGHRVEPSPGDKVRDELTVLLSPVHGFTAPWKAIRFAAALPPGEGSHAAVAITRAGMTLGAWTPAGIAGSAPFVLALILALKGYRPRGILAVNMPSNWYSLHPIQKPATCARISRNAQPLAERFIRSILAGNSAWWSWNNLYEALCGLVLAPISLAYLCAGRFFLAKLFFANNACNGCGICAENCPVQAITMVGKKQPRPFFRFNCESCMRCAAFCPKNAVEAGQSWGVLFYFGAWTPVCAYVVGRLGQWVPAMEPYLAWPVLGTLLETACFFPLMLLAYACFFWLMRVTAINWIFTHTTLTHFWRRYKEPSAKIKQMTKPLAEAAYKQAPQQDRAEPMAQRPGAHNVCQLEEVIDPAGD